MLDVCLLAVCGFVNSVDTFILFVGDDLFVWWWFCLLLLASSLIVCLVIGYLLFGNLFVCFVVCFVRLDNGLARVGLVVVDSWFICLGVGCLRLVFGALWVVDLFVYYCLLAVVCLLVVYC